MDRRSNVESDNPTGVNQIGCTGMHSVAFSPGAHAVLLCFDLTDLESFQNCAKWLNDIATYCPPEVSKFLVGTKVYVERLLTTPSFGVGVLFSPKQRLKQRRSFFC